MIRRIGAAVVSGLIVAVGGALFVAVQAGEERIKFPADYRTTFTNYLSLDRTQNADQIIRLFANDVALKAAKEGGEFPNGSVLVAEIYKAKLDADGEAIESALGRRIRDKFAAIGVMEKGEGWGAGRAKELDTGDWDFAVFKPDGTRAKKDLDACRKCHAPLKETKHLFSYEHLK